MTESYAPTYNLPLQEATLADLFLVSNEKNVDRHVVFIHGLRRGGHQIWMSGEPPEPWPLWLAEDIENLAIWVVGYDASPTLWRGHSMARVDRANNVLARLLAEERLRSGDVAVVAHSFGGLVFEQMLRTANERAPSEPAVADLLRRISRVTFLGTPHRGADLATWAGRLRLLARPSNAARGLERNDPDLRDLNQFYRRYASRTDIDTQSLVETRPVRWFGMIVQPDSADVGLPSAPIPVDADHFDIAAPPSRTSDVYIHVRDQLRKPVRSRKTVIADVSVLQGIAEEAANSSTALARIEERLSSHEMAPLKAAVPSFLVDAETNKRAARVRRMRFFQRSSHLEEATELVQSLMDGPLAATSAEIKADALAWCARVLLAKPDRQEANRALDEARRIKRTETVLIAEALLDSYNDSASEALRKLSLINSNDARAASFVVVINAKDKPDALDWFYKAGLSTSSISSDGKFFLLKKQLDSEMWPEALSTANELQDADFEQTPALAYEAADAHLVQAVPVELRSSIRAHLPFDADPIPLADDASALEERRKACALYERGAELASGLGCTWASSDASDRALWLKLRDPSSRAAALAELQMSMRNPQHSLRRLPMALQFGIKLDLKAVESELDRQDTLSDGSSPEVALARFSLALTKRSAREVAAYIAEHKAKLMKHLNPVYIASVEIQMLIQSGQTDLAEERINELPTHDDVETVRGRLKRILAEARGANPIESREAEFKASNSLADLANLVHRLEEQGDWSRMAIYGREFFNRTHELSACKSLAHALFETKDYDGVLQLLNQHPDLLAQSDYLEAIRAWSLYQTGDVRTCRDAVIKLRAKRDEHDDRVLLVNLAIASGDWTSLGAFVEQEWDRRSERTADELLQAGQLAHHLGSGRARQLIDEAADRANGDPQILIGCYGAAISAGREDEQTTRWLENAAALSGDDGPVQRMSLKDIVERHPEWQQRETRTWEQLRAGDLPMFGAGHLLNRTLFEMMLMPAIANSGTPDARKRPPVYAYSGARRFFRSTAKAAAFDPTALLTLELLGALQSAFEFFDRVIIPHGTLGWLFEEKQRVQFHQPSRIVDARTVKDLVDAKKLTAFDRTATIDLEFASEVGDDLAAMFAEAENSVGSSKQRLVVRSSPIHRVGSLMEEEADLGLHAALVCSCADVVAALARLGQLTQAEEQRAVSYLKLQEKPWPSSVSIEAGAVLYLDELSVTYLQHIRVLGKLHDAGLIGIVPPSEMLQSNGFSKYEGLAKRVTAIIDGVRGAVFNGIETGKVALASSTSEDDLRSKRLQRHPTFELMRAAALADVVVVDDRHFNQHGNITGDFGVRQVWTTYDLLTFSLSNSDLREKVTALRRAGLCFIPLKQDELMEFVQKAPVVDGKLIETAELKAVRESILVAQLSDSLQLPKEAVWLDTVSFCFIETIKAQWPDGIDEAMAIARSNWLLEPFDIRRWASRYHDQGQPNAMSTRYRDQLLSLGMLNTGVKFETKQKYWRWYESALLEKVHQEEREFYAEIIDQVRSLILDAATKEPKEAADDA
ncbi:pimeloyl-ACP methyl ester carboxylesterase [Bradyrhizobium diazoefficiens]